MVLELPREKCFYRKPLARYRFEGSGNPTLCSKA